MNKIMEYMYFGLPIVAFDLRETRFSAQEAALYAPANSETAMASSIAQLLDDEPRRRLMATSASAGCARASPGNIRSRSCWAPMTRSLLAPGQKAVPARRVSINVPPSEADGGPGGHWHQGRPSSRIGRRRLIPARELAGAA